MNNPTQETIWQQIDSAAYLFLGRLFEPRDNQLTIVLEEAISNKLKSGPTVLPGGITLQGDSAPIEHTADCRVFTLSWKNYVSYCVTEEMHGSCGRYEEEIYTGRLLRIYSKSNFLDFLEKNTGAHANSYQHFEIACLNHIIDIAAIDAPTLSVFSHMDSESIDQKPIQ
jgi:hypothetical protein